MKTRNPLQDEPTAAAFNTVPAAVPAPRRRRLWHLPTQAHELLLAMSFTPEWLRKEAARTLGHIHQGQCVLKGSDVDVLYSVVHDLATRNRITEAFQKHLDQRHALAMRRLAKLHDAEALRAAWSVALGGDDMPATLWALLTHPLGPALESAALYDARAWVFAHARCSVARVRVQQQAEAHAIQARRETEDLRSRLAAHQLQAAQARDHARVEIARLTGELARVQGAVNGPARPAAAERHPHPCTHTRHAAPVATVSGGARAPQARPAMPTAASAVQAAAPPKPGIAPIVVQGRRVLCVGGIQHAVARYRGRIETLGGKFEHHDGGLEDSLQALEGRLCRAEVVICQAACINHEAYHRVKRHCERTGKPCVYLDRPSLSRFDRAIASNMTDSTGC